MIGPCIIAIAAATMGQTSTLTYSDTFTGSMENPGRLAVAPGGGVYVTDQSNGVVIEYDAAGAELNIYAVSEEPLGIAVDAIGNVFISRGDGEVGRYNASFVLQELLDPTPLTLVGPNALAVHPDTGELYVADGAGNKIVVFSDAGGPWAGVRSWGIEGSALSEFEQPLGLAIDPVLDRVLVGDADNSRVQVFSTSGMVMFKFGYRTAYTSGGQETWMPRSGGLAVDSCSNIYVADALMGSIRVFSAAGVDLDLEDPPIVYGTGPGELTNPADVLIDGGGGMYIASTSNSAIEVFTVVCTAASPAPAMGSDRSTRASSSRDVSAPAVRKPRGPDNPFDLASAIESGTYVRKYDLNMDRQVNIADLKIAVRDFGIGSIDDFLSDGPAPATAQTSFEAPHIIDLPYACGRCHAMNDMPLGIEDADGQANLCRSCHNSSGLANTMPLPGIDSGASHPWGVPADQGISDGPDAGSLSEMEHHLDDGDIRCGTCHNQHTYEDGARLTRAPIVNSGQLCGECHFQGTEWLAAGHADVHADPWSHYDWAASNRASCRQCHSGYGFIDFSNGLESADQRGDFRVLDCVVCHAPHGSSDPDLLRVYDDVTLPGDNVITDAGPSATCMACHNGRRTPGGSSLTPHYLLGGVMLTGINAAEFGATLTNSAHTSVATCVACHMAPSPAEGNPGAGKVGGHSFNMVVHDQEDPDHDFENFENSCNVSGCHADTGPLTTFNRTAYGDYDGDGTTEGIQDEVQGLMTLVYAEIIATGAVDLGGYPYWNLSAVDPAILQTVRDSIWNYKYVSTDHSMGIHNTAYTVGVLQATYEALTGDAVPDAELRYLPAGFGETVVVIQSVNGGDPVEAGGGFTVDFTIEDELGNPVSIDDLDRLRLRVAGNADNYQRVIDYDGDMNHYVQNGDDSYTYTAVDPFPSVYLAPLNDSPAYGVADGELTGFALIEGTYTVLIETRRSFGSIRKAGDATMDFVVADDPMSPPALDARQFVLRENCNQCHNDLQIHGSNRFAVTGCVVCHTRGAEDKITDPVTSPGVTIQLGDMIHKIHRGHDMASVAATANGVDPYRYEVIGYGSSVHDFSDVGFPTIPGGVTDCEACHGGAAQGLDIYENATRANCGGCHEDMDFATGTILDETEAAVDDGLLTVADLGLLTYRAFPGHDEFGAGGQDHTAASDAFCAGCHGTTEDEDSLLAHLHPTDDDAEGVDPTIEILSVAGMTGGRNYFVDGDYPEITFKLSNSTTNPLRLVAEDPTVVDRIYFMVAGPTTLYQTILEAQQPWKDGDLNVPLLNWVDNFDADGTYTFISEDPLPANYPAQANSLGEPPAEQIFSFADGWGQQYTVGGTPLDNGTYTIFGYGRRVTPTDGEREPLTSDQFDIPFGADAPLVPYGGTVATANCNACHGVLAFHGNQREGVVTCLACHTAGSQDGGTNESVDLRIMAHKLHNAKNLTNLPYELNGHYGVADFSNLLIPSMPGEAAECQECHVNDDWKSPPLRTNMRTWMAACTSCHDSVEASDHADLMTIPGTFIELCTLCHGDGGPFPVEVVHGSP